MDLYRVGAIQGDQAVSEMTSLHERLGGLDAIKTVVDSFVARAAADDRINKKFARTDVPRPKKENI